MVVDCDSDHLLRLLLSDHILVELCLDCMGGRDLAELKQLLFYFFLLFPALMALAHKGAEVDLPHRDSENISQWNSL